MVYACTGSDYATFDLVCYHLFITGLRYKTKFKFQPIWSSGIWSFEKSTGKSFNKIGLYSETLNNE